MALSTRSKFFYGWEVLPTNKYIDFNDGTSTLQAELTIGTYTPDGLAQEIALKMNSVASVNFTVTFNRSTKKFTISSASNFQLLFGSGLQYAQSIASMIGFAASDYTSANTYTSPVSSGYEYAPQFYLQSYKPTSNNRSAIDAVVNKSASGVIEVIKFGSERFMSCEIIFITDIYQALGSVITNDQNAVSSYISFIEWCTNKSKVQFMPDINNLSTYQDFILESTDASSDGLDYELIELYDRGLANYFRSGNLKFRLLE